VPGGGEGERTVVREVSCPIQVVPGRREPVSAAHYRFTQFLVVCIRNSDTDNGICRKRIMPFLKLLIYR